MLACLRTCWYGDASKVASVSTITIIITYPFLGSILGLVSNVTIAFIYKHFNVPTIFVNIAVYLLVATW